MKADGTKVPLEILTKSAFTPPTTAVPSRPKMVLKPDSSGTPNRRPIRIRMETEDQHKSRLAEQEQNDELVEKIRNLEIAARLEKQKEQRRKQEGGRRRKEAVALELLRLISVSLPQERAKEENERKGNEEREAPLRSLKLVEEARLCLKEEAANVKAATIEPEPEEREEGEVEAHKGYRKQDRQPELEDGKDVDIETSESMQGGKDKPKDGLRILEKSMMTHLDEDRATTSRNCAIRLLQEQEDGLMTDQKIAMVLCFMEDDVAANTYILLTDPEVRRGWILKMLKKCPM